MEWLTTVLRGLSKPLQWWVVVASWEQGLLVRLGKHTRLLLPGIHLRIPFLDRVYIQSVRLRTISFSGMQCLTRDSKTIVVSVAISFSVRNIVQLYNSVSTPEYTLESMAARSIIEIVGTLDFNELRINDLERNLQVPDTWGLTDISIKVTSFAVCRAFRLITNDYRTSGTMWNLDKDENTGERK